ncbi:MAG: 50S ribosomal protein L9 [candidate division KSB1 bacterium]|nr:50S ribosomal protein L9 [candidate division KSB1 bacterium]MDZ7302797.1 50S ribosomal protein L9 [candidate division KSB1 bacterium]MDZ7310038.1 50S ribosomal protein L9 [candidate division KSB1 bacterium]
MKVILRQDFESLGEAGKVLTVKDGYARNFLIPRGIAYEATARNLRQFDQDKLRLEAKQNREKRGAYALKEKLDGVSVTATVPVGEEDRVFGSVTTQDIAELLAAKGFEIDRRKIQLAEPIKALGFYEVPVKLHAEVQAIIKVWVVKQ